jgi:hypothetical protein
MATPVVPPNTQDKLEEARYFLHRMELTESPQEFPYNVSAFLSAVRSVKDTLISEISAGLKDGPHEARIPRVKADVEKAMRGDAEMQLLLKKRNITIHQGLRLVDATWEEVEPWTMEADESRRDWLRRYRVRQLRRQPVRRSTVSMPGPRPPTLAPRWFFTDINDRDAYWVCARHLGKVTLAVSACLARHDPR